MARFVTNLDIFMFLHVEGDMKNWIRLYDAVIHRIPVELCSEDLQAIKSFIKTFISNLNRRWASASRNRKTFMNRHDEWLQSNINWPHCTSVSLIGIFQGHHEDNTTVDIDAAAVVTQQSASSRTSVGTSTKIHMRKPFTDLGNRQKKRRVEHLLDYSPDELSYALVTRLKMVGKNDLACVIDHILKNPESVALVQTTLCGKNKKQHFDEDHALALYTSLSLSKWKYLCLRKVLSDCEVPVLPSYHKLLEAKTRCYPNDIEVTESGARVKVQALLDLTVQKILQVSGSQVDSSTEGLKLISKWGFDGASSQSTYKQRSEAVHFNDSTVFMSSLVPLKLVSNYLIIWENPKPSSTYYCRPIKFEFCKETAKYIKEEEALLKEEIANVTTTKLGGLEISHELHMTMIDGKVATIITDTSSASVCNICLAKPTDMNKLSEVFSRPPRENIYMHGLSSLHMWIRCMEFILHVSYNMDFKMWSARDLNKEIKAAKKQLIQEKFMQQMGLLVDFVKQGFGTTNDGNTARRFFRDYEKSAEITNIDKDLIKHFAVILQAIASGNPINIEGFRSYCRETAELFVHLYPWFYMPASVHKLLVHGADICQHFGLLPIGILSEEAGEARNKDFRNVRERHTRKFNRISANEDLLHNLLISSDPYLSHIRPKCSNSKQLELFPESVELLSMPVEVIEDTENMDMPELQPEDDPLM